MITACKSTSSDQSPNPEPGQDPASRLLVRVGNIELPGEPKRIQSVFVGGLKSLPWRWRRLDGGDSFAAFKEAESDDARGLPPRAPITVEGRVPLDVACGLLRRMTAIGGYVAEGKRLENRGKPPPGLLRQSVAFSYRAHQAHP